MNAPSIVVLLLMAAIAPPGPGSRAFGADEHGEDLFYFADQRLIVLRVRVRIDGRDGRSVWNEYVDRLFADLDENKDGIVSAAEADAVPIAPATPQRRSPPPDSERVDSADWQPRDGKVTRDELAEYLNQNGAGAFTTEIGPQSRSAVRVYGMGPRQASGNELFPLMDADGDGKLSRREFANARRQLRKRDLDEDEMISAAELRSLQSPYMLVEEQQVRSSPKPFLTSLSAATSSRRLLARLLERYDRPDASGRKDDRLTRRELGFSESAFAEVDADGNGKLDSQELEQLVRKPPAAITLLVRLGKRNKGQPPIEILASDDHVDARVSAGGPVSVILGDAQIEISAESGGADSFKRSYLAHFKSADRDNNNYLQRDEARQNYYFRAGFDTLDADNDGKLYEQELAAYLDRQAAAAESRTVLRARQQGRNLFEILDLDRDRRLSVREFRAAVDRMELWDANGDRFVAEAEVPTYFTLSVGRGRPALPGSAPIVVSSTALSAPAERQSIGGPVWFRKMDRNGDGDVSRREFLGSLKQFNKLDADQDGLLDLAEAIAAATSK